MSDFSLVPVDHQPDFSDVSLVPVDHDPFSADGIVEQARAQPGGPPQQLASRVGQPDVGPPVNNVQTVASGESYDPDLKPANGVPAPGPPYNLSPTPTLPPDNSAVDWSRYSQPFGELKPATYTPTQRIGYLAADALMGLGMQPYTANDLASRVGNLLGLTPLGVAGSALNLIDAKRRDDLPGALVAAAGMIPGAKGVARGVAAAEERAAAIAKGELSANAPTGNFYSVLYEAKLKPTSYPGLRRTAHNQEGNENLLQDMEGYDAFARDIQNFGVDLRRTPTGLAPRDPPTGFSWHHGEEPGVLQLVPREQHDQGSSFQDVLHPDGRGGFSKWGK
jgi:hypothetical protein